VVYTLLKVNVLYSVKKKDNVLYSVKKKGWRKAVSLKNNNACISYLAVTQTKTNFTYIKYGHFILFK